MSWRDRPYADGGDNWSRAGGGVGGVSFGLPKPTRVVTYLLIINVALFVLMALSGGLADTLTYIGVMTVWQVRLLDGTPVTSGGVLTGEIWRLVTYQYLHSMSSAFHLFFNMLGLYFLGPPLEARWGSKTFFVFYTACGVAGAILFTLLVVAGFIADGPMVGASGSVLGLLAGCAVLMPGMIIILLLFPVPIRTAAILLVAVYMLNLLVAFSSGYAGAGGDAAHLGGMAFGAVWCIWGWTWLQGARQRRKQGAWQQRMERERELQAEVDRILAKVHDHGIQSLTRREKRTLSEATEAQKSQEQHSRHL
jgi:membrane associated rhomboid family serine protease